MQPSFDAPRDCRQCDELLRPDAIYCLRFVVFLDQKGRPAPRRPGDCCPEFNPKNQQP